MLVANAKIELELRGRRLRITLSFPIRHQHQVAGEPNLDSNPDAFKRFSANTGKQTRPAWMNGDKL